MYTIQYTTLNYYNSCISEECLCVGVLFHNLSTEEIIFNKMKNFKRLASFDDEIDIDFFKCYLESIKRNVENNIFNYDNKFNLAAFVRPYVNELRFSTIREDRTNDPHFIDNITKLFLKFDLIKKERLTDKDEKKYIQSVLSASNINFRTTAVIGSFEEPISFDFFTDNYAIKLFKFDKKQLNRLIRSAKYWAFNAEEIKKDKKTIFIYDVDIVDSKDFDAIISILQKYAFKVLPLETGINFLSNIS